MTPNFRTALTFFGFSRNRSFGAVETSLQERLRGFAGDKRRTKILALLLLILFGSGAVLYDELTITSTSEPAGDHIARLYTELNLLPDYKLDIREVFEIELAADSLHKGFVRSVALNYLDSTLNARKVGIFNIQVLDDARGIEILDPKNEEVSGVRKIWVGDPENPMKAGLNRFILRYTISGAVEESEQGDILRFSVSDVGMPLISAAQIRLNIDPKLQLQNVQGSGWINLNEGEVAGRRVVADEAQVLILPKKDSSVMRVIGVEQGGVFFEIARPLGQGEFIGLEVRFG